MLAAVAVAALFALACVLAVVVLVTTRDPPPPPPKQPPKQPPPPPRQPPAPPRQQPTRGKKLDAACKITGDVFSTRGPGGNGLVRTNVRATYHTYSPHYDTGTLACADIVHAWPNYSAKMLQYPWFAYCLDGKSFDPKKVCGRCFRVTNRATGASVIGRAVDHGGCSGGAQNGLDLDTCTFNAIDTKGQGVRDGHLMVDVTEVAC